MKKFLFIIAFITTLGVINANAQQGGGEAEMVKFPFKFF
jgi:hypothetical protein